MFRYLVYLLLQLCCMAVCYLTNWLVILFADKQGELPGILRLWQTWDDTLDNKTDIARLPACLQYNWDAHYIQRHRTEYGRIRYTETLIKPFSLVEKMKRYCCRVHWLYRNCGYGFEFYIFGRDVFPPIDQSVGKDWYFVSQDLTWAFRCNREIKNGWRWNIYLG